MIRVNTIHELSDWIKKGYYPLYQWRYFEVDSLLRQEFQSLLFAGNLFGRGDIPLSNQKFYTHCWNLHTEKQCQECFKPLYSYSATFISHILSRSNYPEHALDTRNHNLLCGRCHAVWESPQNKTMFLYKVNQLIIKHIKTVI